MLIDLLNAENYLMINMEGIRVLGLINAAYCASLLNIYKKAHEKKKLYDDKYFLLNREYVQTQTSLSEKQQLECDEFLIEQGIIERSELDPNKITINVEKYASLLAAEQIVLPTTVESTAKVKMTKEEKAERKRQVMIDLLKNEVQVNIPSLKFALNDWIDSCMDESSSKHLCKAQVNEFVRRLNEYCVPDCDKALAIVKIAMVNQYVNCDWAINVYEKDRAEEAKKLAAKLGNSRIADPKITTKVSSKTF